MARLHKDVRGVGIDMDRNRDMESRGQWESGPSPLYQLGLDVGLSRDCYAFGSENGWELAVGNGAVTWAGELGSWGNMYGRPNLVQCEGWASYVLLMWPQRPSISCRSREASS